jgi:hypothetical protein
LWEDGPVKEIKGSETFRARGNVPFAGVVELFCGFYLWSSFVQGGARNIATTGLVVIAISAANYATFVRPLVRFSSDGIDVINPLSSDFITWDEIEEIDARWCMSITAGIRTIHAYGAPAPGRHRARSVHETEMRGIKGGESGFIRPARSPKSDSGACVHIAGLWQEEHAKNPVASQRSSAHQRTVLPLLVVGASGLLAIVINLH